MNLVPGSSATIEIKAVPEGDFPDKVAIDCSGLPSSVTLDPNHLELFPGAPGAMGVHAPVSAPDTDSVLACTGTAAGLTKSAELHLAVKLDNGFVPSSMDLPIVRITTAGGVPIESKEEYVTGILSIDPNGGPTPFAYEGALQIRGRGNSSWWLAPKKPYKIKLDSKASLFGFPSDKEWAVLANFPDKTLIRNIVAMEMSSRFEMAYTPRSIPVEVFLNGRYNGEYLWIETIKVSKKRVAIAEMEDDDIADDAVTGGYLLEVNMPADEDFNFTTTSGVTFSLHDPSPPAAEQLTYITQYVQQTEDAIFSVDFADPEIGYAHYLDVDSFINWYLLNELFSNPDANFQTSCWMYKDRNAKLFMGPAWDFDLGAGNANFNDSQLTSGWHVRSAPWLMRLFEDPAFASKVRARWNEMKAGEIDTIFSYVDQQAARLDQAQQNNFQRWPILELYVWPNTSIPGSYQGEVDQLKSWLEERIAWMDTEFNKAPE